VPSNAAPANCMRNNGETYEHIGVYVDNVVAMKDLETPRDTTTHVHWDDITHDLGGFEVLVTHFHNGQRPSM
jgi:hypothetical protein